MDTFSAQACIRFGWETFKKRPWFLIGANLFYFVVLGIVSAALSEIGKVGPAANFATSIINWVVQTFAGMGLIAFLLKAHDDVEHVALEDFWHPQNFWKYLGASILFVLTFVGGLILLIIPGIIFGIRYGFATYEVIDRGLRPMEAMAESRRITYGHKWELFLLAILSALVALLGLVCLIVGIFVAIPVTSLAFVHAYRVLQKQAGNVPAPVAA
jgi:hypothetical protein